MARVSTKDIENKYEVKIESMGKRIEQLLEENFKLKARLDVIKLAVA